MRIISLLSAVTVITLLLASSADAWWCTGHMIIAEIARQTVDSAVRDEVNKNFAFLNTWFAETNDMVSGACWADDLKSDKLEAMAGWHFINQPYNPNNVPIHPWPIQNVNVETNIMSLGDTIHRDKSREWVTSFAVANLVHFYGDIHQPLHATELFDAAFPNGDKGGNDFDVMFDGTQWRLHFIWDSVCGLYQNEPSRPLNQSAAEYITNLAQQYMSNFSIPDSDKKTYNSTVMALESFDAAVMYAYNNNTLKPHDTLSSHYIETCKQVAGFRIAAAGYRLGNQLEYLFKRGVSGQEMLQHVHKAKMDYHHAIRDHGPRRG